MVTMTERREHYEVARKIIDRLEEKGPATPKQLRDELVVHKNSVNRNLRGILLKKLGIVEKLDNDKYGLKWHLPEEDEVKLHYHRTKRKLKRNPTPEEMAGLIKESPDDARRV
jgi:Mn-dependent DtxR family transcriptional regulator